MTIWTFLCLLAMFVVSEGAEDDGGTINNILLNGPYSCFEQRFDVRCPPRSRCCCRKSNGVQNNGTEECVKRSNPLTHFYLFTSRNKDKPEFLHECGGMLPSNTFYNPKYNTEIFIHGLFDGMCRTAAFREMKDQLFIRGLYNVILVDWTKDNTPDIYDAVKATRLVGKRTACVIRNIMKQTGATKSKFHLVGHSLGGQIAGFVGQNLPGLRRITSLDPANIGFLDNLPDERISNDDAEMVDVIHVNDGNCYPLNMGYPYPAGDADFYPNGGAIQISCFSTIIPSFLKLDVVYGLISLLPQGCFHVQVLQYYKVSINSCNCDFVAVECESYEAFLSGDCRTCKPDGSNCAVMGMDWEYYYIPPKDNKTRKYYLTTGFNCPYCDNTNLSLNSYPKSAQIQDPGMNCFVQKEG